MLMRLSVCPESHSGSAITMPSSALVKKRISSGRASHRELRSYMTFDSVETTLSSSLASVRQSALVRSLVIRDGISYRAEP